MERLRGTDDTGDQMRESFQVVAAKLRRAREILGDRPGTASVLAGDVLRELDMVDAARQDTVKDELAMIVIATSDKGGTGRSVTGSNVVYRRALQGGDVCYVDFDFGSPTAGAIFGVSALSRGTTTGKGTHSYLLGRSTEVERCDVWQNSDRTSLRQRPPGTGQMVLVPGDSGGGEFSFDDDVVGRCIDLFLRLHSEFEVVLVDLSAGRSYAAEIVIAATSSPELANVTTRWLVFHRWTRQHILAANGLVFGERGLLDIGEAHGMERDTVHRGHPFRPDCDRRPQRARPRRAAAAAARLAPRGQQRAADSWPPS